MANIPILATMENAKPLREFVDEVETMRPSAEFPRELIGKFISGQPICVSVFTLVQCRIMLALGYGDAIVGLMVGKSPNSEFYRVEPWFQQGGDADDAWAGIARLQRLGDFAVIQ